MDLLTNIVDILWAVVRSYFTHGWLFVIAHIAVLYFLLQSRSKVNKASEELENWRPQTSLPDSAQGSKPDEYLKPVLGGSQAVGILDQYVTESEKMGAQGAFVPMSDYSDRLDSIIDGLIIELQDRTNLFLIVGIAGTLFGLFEFAFLSYAELQNSSPQAGGQLLKLGSFLSQSMSKAFPVGFVGLLLTFVTQLWAARPEGRLRAALAGAAQRALERRKDAAVSQVENLRQAGAAIQKAMQPLENLSFTLSEGLKPVAEALGERMDRLMNIIEVQFRQTQQATQGLQDTVSGLKAGVNSINAVTTRVEELFRQLPAVLKNLAELQSRQLKSIQTIDKQAAERFEDAQKLNAAIRESIENFGKMPQQLAGDFKAVFAELGADTLKIWDDYLRDYTIKLQSVYQDFLHNINISVGDVKNGLTNAANELQRVAQNFDHLVRGPIEDLFAKLREDLGEDLKKLDQVVAERYPQAAKDIIDFTGQLEALLAQSNELQRALTVWLTGVQEAGSKIQSLNIAMAEAANRLPSAESSATDPQMLQLLRDIGQSLREMQAQLAGLNGVSQEVRGIGRRLEDLRQDMNQTSTRGWFGTIFGTSAKRRGNASVN
jgi:archaellum component FlaC